MALQFRQTKQSRQFRAVAGRLKPLVMVCDTKMTSDWCMGGASRDFMRSTPTWQTFL